jgi:hypothetical protein
VSISQEMKSANINQEEMKKRSRKCKEYLLGATIFYANGNVIVE